MLNSPQLSPYFLCRSCRCSVISSVIVRALNAFRVLGSRHTGGSTTSQETSLSAAREAVPNPNPIGPDRLFSGRSLGSIFPTDAAAFEDIYTAAFETIYSPDHALICSLQCVTHLLGCRLHRQTPRCWRCSSSSCQPCSKCRQTRSLDIYW